MDRPRNETFKGMINTVYKVARQYQKDQNLESLEWLAAHIGRLYDEIDLLNKDIKMLKRKK